MMILCLILTCQAHFVHRRTEGAKIIMKTLSIDENRSHEEQISHIFNLVLILGTTQREREQKVDGTIQCRLRDHHFRA